MASAMSEDEREGVQDGADGVPTVKTLAYASDADATAERIGDEDERIEGVEAESIADFIQRISMELLQAPELIDLELVKTRIAEVLAVEDNPELRKVKACFKKLAKLFDIYSLSRPEAMGEFSSLTIDKAIWRDGEELKGLMLSDDRPVLLACKKDKSVICGQILDEMQLALLQSLFAGIITADNLKGLFHLMDEDTPACRSLASMTAVFEHAKKLGSYAIGILIKHFYQFEDKSFRKFSAITSIDDGKDYDAGLGANSHRDIPVVFVLTKWGNVNGRG